MAIFPRQPDASRAIFAAEQLGRPELVHQVAPVAGNAAVAGTVEAPNYDFMLNPDDPTAGTNRVAESTLEEVRPGYFYDSDRDAHLRAD